MSCLPFSLDQSRIITFSQQKDPPCLPAQRETIKKLTHFSEDEWKFKSIKVQSDNINVSWKRDEQSSEIIRKVEADLLCAAEEVAAWYFLAYGDDKKLGTAGKKDAIVAQLTQLGEDKDAGNEKIVATVRKSSFWSSNKEVISRLIWDVSPDGSTVTVGVFPSKISSVDYGDDVGGTSRVFAKSLLIATKQESSTKGVDRCKVTLYEQVQNNFNAEMYMLQKKSLSDQELVIRMAMEMYNNDKKVFRLRMASLMYLMKNSPQVLDEREKEIIVRGQAFYYHSSKNSSNSATTRSNGVSSTVMNYRDPRISIMTVGRRGESCDSTVATAVIESDIITCLAFEFTKYRSKHIFTKKGRGISGLKVKKLNDHCHVSSYKRTTPLLSTRQFRTMGVWEIFEDGSAILAYEDTNDRADKLQSYVMGSYRRVYMFQPLAAIDGIPQTRITFVSKVDLKGRAPSIFTNYKSLRWAPIEFAEDLDELRKFCITNKINGSRKLPLADTIRSRLSEDFTSSSKDKDLSQCSSFNEEGKVRNDNVGLFSIRSSKADHSLENER